MSKSEYPVVIFFILFCRITPDKIDEKNIITGMSSVQKNSHKFTGAQRCISYILIN